MFHPELGNEVVPGTIAIDRMGLHFRSELYQEEISAGDLLVEWDDAAEKIFFKDATRPELRASLRLHARAIGGSWLA